MLTIRICFVLREWHKEAYDENGKLKEEASLTKVIIRVFGFKYMLLAIPAVLAVSTSCSIDKEGSFSLLLQFPRGYSPTVRLSWKSGSHGRGNVRK